MVTAEIRLGMVPSGSLENLFLCEVNRVM
uniref:Uncharacterized protein n=1 Tax=Arundo donax TaxID=35708 RepID=A0A0A9AGT8_ARUDO